MPSRSGSTSVASCLSRGTTSDGASEARAISVSNCSVSGAVVARPARGTERVDSPFQLIDDEPDSPERERRPRHPAAVRRAIVLRCSKYEAAATPPTAKIVNSRCRNPTPSTSAEGDRPVAQRPQREHVQKRFDARAERFEQVGRQDRVADAASGRTAASASHGEPIDRVKHAQQPHRDDAVDDHERQPQHGHGRPAEPDERRRDPGLDAEHVVLSVEEERKGPELAEVLGHQADDGLVGIEVEVLVGKERERTEDHDGDRQEAAPEQGGRPLVHEAG